MKLFSAAAQAAIEDGSAIASGAVEILCDPPFRVFGGYGTLAIDGQAYTGIGDRGLVSVTGGSVGGSAQAISLSLSGVELAALALVDANAARGAPAVLRRLIFDGSGTQLLDAQVFARGKVDELPIEETPGGTATIGANIETAARALGRRGGRMRTDADQRLVKAGDGGFRSISYASAKTLYWGGKRPAVAGTSLGGAGGGRGFNARNLKLF